MTKYSVSETRPNFEKALDEAQLLPVEIHKPGKPIAVILDAMK